MKYRVTHQTEYNYQQSVSFSQHLLHLTPRSFDRQICQFSSISISPLPSIRTADKDYFGNGTIHLTIQDLHKQLKIKATSDVEVIPPEAHNFSDSPAWEDVIQVLKRGTLPDQLNAYQFIFNSPYAQWNDEVRNYAIVSFAPGRPILDAAMDLTSRIYSEFQYEGGVTDVSTPVSQVMAGRHGVCQDFAHVQIACLRSLSLPARYVSGYLRTHPPEGQEKLIGADESHAWVSIWCPSVGWVDFDATNNLVPTDEHITIGWGRDYGDVSPINGFMTGGGAHTVKVSVDVHALEGNTH